MCVLRLQIQKKAVSALDGLLLPKKKQQQHNIGEKTKHG